MHPSLYCSVWGSGGQTETGALCLQFRRGGLRSAGRCAAAAAPARRGFKSRAAAEVVHCCQQLRARPGAREPNARAGTIPGRSESFVPVSFLDHFRRPTTSASVISALESSANVSSDLRRTTRIAH